jgi:uncharacterized protein YbaP (TraB family)
VVILLCLVIGAAVTPGIDIEILPSARSAESYDRGLLWKIEGPSGQNGYLFGTIHAEDPKVTQLPQPVRTAFDHADTFTMELVLKPEAIVALGSAMFLDEGRDLENLLGEALYADVARLMEDYGMPPLIVSRMKPWAVFTTLSTPKPQTGLFLDKLLYLEAVEQSKPVYGLETVQEQVAVFDGLSLEDQITILRDTVAMYPTMDRMHRELISSYIERDLAGLMHLNERYMAGDGGRLEALLNRRLIDERNLKMAERMQPRLEAGGAFIAIGALHLPGPTGVLALLAEQGYRLTPIY